MRLQIRCKAGERPFMNERACWVSHPEEWQPLLDEWARQHPDRVTLHDWPQYGGAVVRGLTIAATEPARLPFRLLVTVPHAHEPACTAACVDLAYQLLAGRRRD